MHEPQTRTTIKSQREGFANRLRLLRWVFLILIALVLLVTIAPTICVHTSLRQWLVNRFVSDHVRVTCQRAAFGWMTPLVANDVTLQDVDGSWSLTAEAFRGSQTLWQLLSDSKDLGTAVVERSTITVNVDNYKAASKETADELHDPNKNQTLRLQFVDATILIDGKSFEQPSEFARNVNLTANYTRNKAGRLLEIAPGRIIHQAQLTADMCRSVLKFIVPILADVSWTEGEVSLELSKCTIPLDDAEDSEVEGILQIHNVQTGIRAGLAKQISGLISFASEKTIPTRLKLADESSVNFSLKDGLVRHDNLEFGLPEISDELLIRTRGTVGIDRSLDLTAEIPIPLHLLGEGPIAKALGSKSLTLPISGTLDKPKAQLEGTKELAGELLSDLAGPVLDGDATIEDLLSGIRTLRERRADRIKRNDAQSDRGGLLQRLRDRLAE